METSSRAAQQLSGHCLQGPSSVPFELRIRLPAACSAAVTPAPVCCLANPAGMYSPIQRLVDQQQAMFASFSCGRNATAPFVLDKDSAYSTRPGHDLALPTRVPDDTPFNGEDDDDMSLSARTSEHIGESAGAAGDEYRFRCALARLPRCFQRAPAVARCLDPSARSANETLYSCRYDRVVSPEEGYSPIAAVHLAHRSSGLLDRQHVWSTHIDDDGAVCSQPIPGPLRLAVALPCGSSAQVQV